MNGYSYVRRRSGMAPDRGTSTEPVLPPPARPACSRTVIAGAGGRRSGPLHVRPAPTAARSSAAPPVSNPCGAAVGGADDPCGPRRAGRWGASDSPPAVPRLRFPAAAAGIGADRLRSSAPWDTCSLPRGSLCGFGTLCLGALRSDGSPLIYRSLLLLLRWRSATGFSAAGPRKEM